MSRSTANKHKSLRRSSLIEFRTAVLINFIFEKVLSHVVEDTGIVMAISVSDTSVGKACLNGCKSSYRSTRVSNGFWPT